MLWKDERPGPPFVKTGFADTYRLILKFIYPEVPRSDNLGSPKKTPSGNLTGPTTSNRVILKKYSDDGLDVEI